jgi:glycosyltransferase involved in cell wall biosynthesis
MLVYTLYDTDARVRREAETLVATGRYQVTVFALKDGETPRSYSLDGVEVQQLDAAKYRGDNAKRYILSYVTFTLKALGAITRRAMAGLIDVMHVHNMPNFLIFAALLPLLRGKKVILDVHDTMPETFSSSFTGLRKRLFVPALVWEERICGMVAHNIICVNETQRDALVARYPGAANKTIISMNVPDPNRFRRSDHGAAPRTFDRLRIVYHGALSGRLTVDLAIRALARVSATNPDVELNVIGDGEERAALARLADELNIGGQVIFHGRKTLDELVPIVQSMDLGVVPLGRNPATDLMLSVKLMECLSLGLPVVAPRLQAIQHYFDEDMLFFFDPGDEASLATALLAARDSAERRRRVERAASFLTRYHWDTHKASLLDLYGYPAARPQLSDKGHHTAEVKSAF